MADGRRSYPVALRLADQTVPGGQGWVTLCLQQVTAPVCFTFGVKRGPHSFKEMAIPSGTIGIREFIELVEAEERKWPAREQTLTSLMITRLRKIFYGLPGWDKHLIPGARHIDSGYTIEEEKREEPLACLGPDLVIRRTLQIVKDSTGASPAIAARQEVRLEDGCLDDIGHVLAGLDAANHPCEVSGYRIVTAKDNKAAVTWTGDLGSAIGELVFARANTNALVPQATANDILYEMASPQDMLGDIDAYVMANRYDISDHGGKKVSELLRAFYLSPRDTPDGHAREHRFSKFCELTGLTGWNGCRFRNEKDWVDRWTAEVQAAAALYAGALMSGANLLCQADFVFDAEKVPESRILVRDFLSGLKRCIAAETP